VRYRFEAMRAGFFTEVTEPHYRPFFGDSQPSADRRQVPGPGALARATFALRRLGLARRAYLAWLNHVWGGVSMNMVATKPHRYVGAGEAMGSSQRALRTGLAAGRRTAARLTGQGEPRLPRTPAQAERALRRARTSSAPATGSPRPRGPCG
jgi:hypothetical protein